MCGPEQQREPEEWAIQYRRDALEDRKLYGLTQQGSANSDSMNGLIDELLKDVIDSGMDLEPPE